MRNASTPPDWIAASVSSASRRRSFSDSTSAMSGARGSDMASFLADVEAEEDPVHGRQVADDPAKGEGEFLDQRWCGDDLLAAREFGLLIDVHDLEVVAS